MAIPKGSGVQGVADQLVLAAAMDQCDAQLIEHVAGTSHEEAELLQRLMADHVISGEDINAIREHYISHKSSAAYQKLFPLAFFIGKGPKDILLGNRTQAALRAAPRLIAIAQDRNGSTEDRAKAITLLGNLKVQQAIPILVSLVEDHANTAAPIRLSAAATLGNFQINQVIPRLLPIVVTLEKDQDGRAVRDKVIRALGTSAAKEVVTILASIASNPQEHVQIRKSALETLGGMGIAALPALQKLSSVATDRKEDPEVREVAAASIGKISVARQQAEAWQRAVAERRRARAAWERAVAEGEARNQEMERWEKRWQLPVSGQANPLGTGSTPEKSWARQVFDAARAKARGED